jgi:DNA-binding LacI/PurR family transcriptional regulator
LKRSQVKIQDVAKAAGVSIATVSYVMNGTGRVSEETAEKVRAVIKQLDYQPNQGAINLKNQRSKTLGWVLILNQIPQAGDFWAPIISEIMYKAAVFAHSRGYSMTLIPHDQPEMIKQLNLDGIVLSNNYSDEPSFKYANSLGIPVLTNEWYDQPEAAVNMNFGHRESTIAALELLKKRGGKRIGLFTEQADFSSDYQSEKVYLTWCKENNYAPIVVRGAYDRSDIFESVNKLVDQNVDAIYSFYEHGPEILEALTRLGKRVPEEVLLVANTLDDDQQNRELGISSTIYHPTDLIPEATSALIDIIESKRVAPITIKVPWEINEYTSTKR